ncbi:hypothetical protein GIB67_018406 [Kingdonia uniflora]|uniref:CCHC-type domain-containing protein n=1 Tax=Kingdonia uniflora TaxID=39325 RepID=A0A7J7MJ86_9MAGN|nr:hypothetical protein GIB67_018406 [Kingdonia uniflora]
MFERRTKAESWDQGCLVPRAVKHLKYLMTHYGEYDMEGGDKNEWVLISSTGARNALYLCCKCINPKEAIIEEFFFSAYHFVASYVATYSGIIHPVSDDTHWASPPYMVDLPPLQRGRGRPRKEIRKGDNEVHKEQKKCGKCGAFGHNKKSCKSEPIQIQSAPAPKARGRPSQKSTKVYFNQSQQSGVTQVQTTPIVGGRGSRGRASNAGRGRGRSEGASSGRASNTGRGRGRSECASSSSQSQERPPLVIPLMPPRTYAPTNPYKKTFKPPRQNWRL